MDVEYVNLVALLQGVNITGYQTDGHGVVEATLLVSNKGVAPSGTIDVGVVCPEGATVDCTWSSQMESIPPGETSQEVLKLTVPQGETTASVFAGAIEGGFLWGDANVQEVAINVPLKAAVELVMEAESNIGGYWLTGT